MFYPAFTSLFFLLGIQDGEPRLWIGSLFFEGFFRRLSDNAVFLFGPVEDYFTSQSYFPCFAYWGFQVGGFWLVFCFLFFFFFFSSFFVMFLVFRLGPPFADLSLFLP